MIPFLIGFPVLLAAILFLIRKEDLRGYMVYAGTGVIMLITVIFIMQWIFDGSETWMLYPSTELPDHLIAAGDIFLMGLILYMSLKYKRPLPAILSIVQTVLMLYVESTAKIAEGPHIMVDWFTILMCIIIAFIGGDSVPSSLLDRWNHAMIEWGSEARLYQGYGLTETVNVTNVNFKNNKI